MIMQLSGETETLPLAMDKFKEDCEQYKEIRNGGSMSPPISPQQRNPNSPSSSSERRDHDRPRSSSPSSSNLPNLHHALHDLHNFHNLQSLQSQMAALAGLQGGLGIPGVSSLFPSHLTQQHQHSSSDNHPPRCSPLPNNHLSSENLSNITSNSATNSQGPVPQMVLTAGQVADGVQGAQLLIPTSQGITVQSILTIPLGQAGSMNTSASALASLHHLTSQSQPSISTPQHHNSHYPSHSGSSTNSSPSSSSSSIPHSLLGVLPSSLFQLGHQGSHSTNNNCNNASNYNNTTNNEKHKLSLPRASPVPDPINRLSGTHYRHQHHAATSRYSPDFLDTHNQPTINQTSGSVADGVNLEEIKEFAKAFKIRRLSLGLTQTQVGQALSITEGPAYSQSAICRFEKLDITPKSAQKIKPVLEHWMLEAEDRFKNGQHGITDFMGNEPSKKRKRRTSFTPQALEILNAHFERNTHPSGTEITAMGEQLGYDREVVRIWFCNKRQALKNTVRMMSKGHQGHSQTPLPPHSSII